MIFLFKELTFLQSHQGCGFELHHRLEEFEGCIKRFCADDHKVVGLNPRPLNLVT